MSYGSLPQGRKGRTLSPLQLGTAGMTLSEQTNNTTSNTPHVVRHSDSLFPSHPRLFGSFAFIFASALFACFSFAPPGCVGWGPFAPVGIFLIVPPRPACPFLARSNFFLVVSAVLCPFAFPLGLRPLGLRPFGLLGFLSVASVCVSLGFRCFCCAPSWVWEGPAFYGLEIGSCWLPSLSVVTSPSPSVGPVWRPGPVFTLVPPSGYLVAAVTAQLPCRCAGSVVALCRPSFTLSHGSKGS